MGLGVRAVEALIRERNYRPLGNDVVLIGRQTVYLSPAQLLTLLRELGADVGEAREGDIEVDNSTVRRMPGATGPYVTDRALLQLLGADRCLALDHSSYEGADIIHDLNKPLPQHLIECADFVIDGSTLDNVFDPALALRSLCQMLRPGGRLITSNVLTHHSVPYVILPPLWFFDFFVMNGFVDCKVYVLVFPGNEGPTSAFYLDPDALGIPIDGSTILLHHTTWLALFLLRKEQPPPPKFNLSSINIDRLPIGTFIVTTYAW